MKGVAIVFVAGALLGLGAVARAAETDQFLTWSAELEDATDPVNDFVNRSIEETLGELNDRGAERFACEEIPPRIYRRLYGGILHSRLRHYVATTPAIDRAPDHDVGYFAYLRRSVFRGVAFPYFLPMARTVRIDDVHLGIDKLAHVFGFGRRYHRRYLRAIERGLSEEEALERVVRWGFRVERVLVGGVTDGVVSSADLEANFQGLRLALDLCDAARPHLARVEGSWRLVRPVDLRDYVTPGFDETYNPSLFTARRWKKVKPVLIAEYCGDYRSPEVRARLERYRAVDRPNPSRRLVDALFARGSGDLRETQSLEAICDDGRSPDHSTGPTVASASRSAPRSHDAARRSSAAAPAPH